MTGADETVAKLNRLQDQAYRRVPWQFPLALGGASALLVLAGLSRTSVPGWAFVLEVVVASAVMVVVVRSMFRHGVKQGMLMAREVDAIIAEFVEQEKADADSK